MGKITKPAEVREGFHGILYGKPGVGKTSTADDPVFKTLLIDMEGGSAVLSKAKNVDRYMVEDFKDFLEITEAVKRGYLLDGSEKIELEYDLYVIDSMSALQEHIKQYVVLNYAPSRRREITGKFGAMADWGDLRDIIVRAVKAWHGLTKREDDSVHCIWIAHEQVIKDETTDQATGTKVQLQGKDTADVVMAAVDSFVYMFNRNNKDTKELERGIITQTTGIYSAKVRQSKHSKPLDTFIISPVWSEIFEQLGYVRK